MAEPIIKLQDRALSIGVFEFKNQDGSVNLSCDIQRSYKKKDSQDWTRENIHCYEEDLLKIANLCTRAYNEICKARSQKQPKPTQQKSPNPVPPQPTVPETDDIPF